MIQPFNPPTQQPEAVRWLNELELSSPFWNSLSILGKVQFTLEHPSVTYQGVADLGASFLDSDGHFYIPEPSLTLAVENVARVFIPEQSPPTPPSLEIDLKDHSARLTLTMLSTESTQNLDHLATIFGWEMKPETEALKAKRALRQPKLCSCCRDAAALRVQQITSNPLAWVLRERIESDLPVTFSLPSTTLNLFGEYRPREIAYEGSLLIAKGINGALQIDVRHLHALRSSPNSCDDSSQLQIQAYNNLGDLIVAIAAPLAEIAPAWTQFLNHSSHGYEKISP